MAIYTVENTSRIGKRVRVFDGLGKEVEKCTYCDDKTGEIERHLIDEKGKPVVDRLKNEIVTIREMRPLPISVERVT